jgi:hypothetical protein
MDRGVVNMDFEAVAELIFDLFCDMGFECGVNTQTHLIELIIEILVDHI